jgi:ABC-2 type transport system ATP-binding protein
MADVMIKVENLTKEYGSARAVDDVSFNVRKGEVLGFLGPNGAGKSTTMKMLTCFLAPTSRERAGRRLRCLRPVS